jgi:hypothetical protein
MWEASLRDFPHGIRCIVLSRLIGRTGSSMPFKGGIRCVVVRINIRNATVRVDSDSSPLASAFKAWRHQSLYADA